MQNTTNSIPTPTKIDVLLFDQFSNHCLANTIEPLRAANALADSELYDWRYASLNGGTVISSSGLPVATKKLQLQHGSTDMLFAMPSYGYRNLATPQLFKILRQAEKQAIIMVGLDTGAWLFAAAGLLDGKAATIHAAILEDFTESFLSVDVRSDRHVSDGNFITCGGAMAAFDLALHLIDKHHGAILRHEVEALFLYQNEPLEVQESPIPPRSVLVKRALKLMDDNLETPKTVMQISQQLGCSTKELQRRFARSFGMTPSQVLQHKKLSQAKALIMTTQMPISEITVRCGYENASAMTRAFKAKYRTTPLALRLEAND